MNKIKCRPGVPGIDKKILILLVVLSGILLPLALPNELFKYGVPYFSFFCITPLFIAISLSPSFRFTTLLGAIFGILKTIIGFYWLSFFGNYTVWTIGGVTFAYILYDSLLALYLHLFQKIGKKYRPFLLAAAWTLYEFLKSSGFLAFPWGLLPQTVHSILPLIQFVDITGIWGLSFLIALINAVISENLIKLPLPIKGQFKILKLLKRRDFSQIIFTCILIILTLIYGTIRYLIPIPVTNSVTVLLIQQNRDPWEHEPGSYEKSILLAESITEKAIMNKAEADPDIIVWSETSFQTPISANRRLFKLEHFPDENPFIDFVQRMNKYILVGAPYYEKENFNGAMNSTVLFSPKGEVVQYYGKQHPVPFVESIPFWELDFIKSFFINVVGIHGIWQMGNEYKIFNIPLKDGTSLNFSTPICFEDAFPDLCRRFILGGADLWINLSNVSWSQTESAEIQMLVASKFRAIENKRVLIRSTNSGVTCIIGPKGNVWKSIPLFTAEHLLFVVPVMKDKTLSAYTAFGDYFPYLVAIILILFIVFKTGKVFLSRISYK